MIVEIGNQNGHGVPEQIEHGENREEGSLLDFLLRLLGYSLAAHDLNLTSSSRTQTQIRYRSRRCR